jgi:hypothetical protein
MTFRLWRQPEYRDSLSLHSTLFRSSDNEGFESSVFDTPNRQWRASIQNSKVTMPMHRTIVSSGSERIASEADEHVEP